MEQEIVSSRDYTTLERTETGMDSPLLGESNASECHPLASVGSLAIAGDQQIWQRLASSSAASTWQMKKGGSHFLKCPNNR